MADEDRVAVAAGFLPADGKPRAPARRLPSIEPPPLKPRRPGVALARRLGFIAIAVLRIPLLPTMAALTPLSILMVWRQRR